MDIFDCVFGDDDDLSGVVGMETALLQSLPKERNESKYTTNVWHGTSMILLKGPLTEGYRCQKKVLTNCLYLLESH
jgi:hypothetical protein